MGYAAHSQTIDTICFPVVIAQKVLIAAEQKKVLEERVTILNERIVNLQGIIKDLQGRDSVTILTYEKQIKELELQRDINEKLLKKEKRKRLWTGIAGVAATAGALFIGMK